MVVAERTPKLTERQEDVLRYIVGFINDQGYPPTVRDISHCFGIKSNNGVLCSLDAIEKKGFITRERNVSRGIRLTDQRSKNLARIALLDDETIERITRRYCG